MPLPVSMDATWLNGSTSFNAQELRRADAAEFNGDGTAFGVRGGIVRHGDNSLAVTVNASDVVTVQPGAVVVPGNSGVGNGCYRSALGAADTGNLTARNATNPRIDLVVFRVLDDDVVTTHDAYTGRIEIIAGTPAASPVVPALPSLAVELARITVPATGGGTATVDSSHRQYASAVSADLVVASFARLPTSAAKWQKAIALDTGLEYVWTGTAWEPDRAPRGALGVATVTSNQTGVTTEVDLTGMTVTVTVGAGRRIRISFTTLLIPAGAVNTTASVTIKEGATVLRECFFLMNNVSAPVTATDSVVLTPSSGSHTYKLTLSRAVGAGSVETNAQSTRPAYILVEDIGSV